MTEADRIVTVSTIKDTPLNVRRLVTRNLSSGVDHMIIFLDADQPEVMAVLADNPNVTAVQTASDYWADDRPDAVVDRQMVNASVALTAVAQAASVRWIFHIDGDEALAFDRAGLLAIDSPAVVFGTLEAVARRRWRNGEPKLFKRVPDRGELHTLSALGYLPAPDPDDLFRGHTIGKCGVRPAEGLRFRLHSAYALPDVELPSVKPSDMYVLHYETTTFDDFVARWSRDYTRASDDPFKNQRIAAAFHLLSNSPGASEAERRRQLEALFDRLVADDLEALRLFKLVVRNPRRSSRPRTLPSVDVRHIEQAIGDLRGVDKSAFRSTLLRGGKYAKRTAL